MQAAVSDFKDWEPGKAMTCDLCHRTRGGDDPPGPWARHYPTQTRRIPIYDAHDRRRPVGYMEFFRL